MPWEVTLRKKVVKALKSLPQPVIAAFTLLLGELESSGPVRGNWPNYGKLNIDGRHHCHLKKGKPTYVAVWDDVSTGNSKKIEVEYVGTHEKAPY